MRIITEVFGKTDLFQVQISPCGKGSSATVAQVSNCIFGGNSRKFGKKIFHWTFNAYL